MLPLFERYPRLYSKLPYIQLCELPTPIQPLKQFGKFVHHSDIYIKRDDLSGKLFGGNKVRSLEFLLAAAKDQGRNLVIGLPGTSMALAANVYARKLGIPIETVLLEQRATLEAQENLRYFQFLGADLLSARIPDQNNEKFTHPEFSSLVPDYNEVNILNPTSPLGMCGYVNAAFELNQQVIEEQIPEPDFLYVPTGLLGTATGLMLGLKAAGMKTQVVCCSVQPGDETLIQGTRGKIMQLYAEANAFLNKLDGSFSLLPIEESEIKIRSSKSQTTEDYQEKALNWIPRFYELEGVSLDATWTAQAIASLIHDMESDKLNGKVILYWHTFNSRPYPPDLAQIDYHELPEGFWHYFETDQLTLINKPELK